MWRWWFLGLASCFSSDDSNGPGREREVLIDAFPGGTVIYRDGDGPWRLAPQIGDRYGFDVEEPRFAVALVDPDHGRVDSVYTTLSEDRDFVWLVTERPPPPTHVVSGTVSNLGAGGASIAAGRATGVLPGSDAPLEFTLEVAEGPHALVFGRRDPASPFPKVEALAVRRDVAVGAALDHDEDFSAALPTTTTPVSVIGSSDGCFKESRFFFGDTEITLGGASSDATVVAPHASQWRGGDHLTFTVSCFGGDGTFRIVARDAPIHEYIPVEIALPYQLGPPIVELGSQFHFTWNGYPGAQYHAVVGPRACVGPCPPRWSARITNGWVGDGIPQAVVISPPDLEALGLMDARLAVSVDSPWSMFAVVDNGDTLLVTGTDQLQ